MSQITRAAIIFFFFTCSIITTGYAIDTLAGKYPRAVLVQLRSEQNRIAALTKAQMNREVEEVSNDAIEIRMRMVNDFNDNFHYCPVYYYIDSNADLIKKKEFDGVLMHADGTPVKSPVIGTKNDDYVIVYYGYALSQSKSAHVIKDTSKYVYDPDPPPGKGLVVLNSRFQQIDYFYKFGYDELIFKLKKKNKKYFYESKRFDMEYFPFAKLFEKNVGDRYSRHRIIPDSE